MGLYRVKFSLMVERKEPNSAEYRAVPLTEEPPAVTVYSANSADEAVRIVVNALESLIEAEHYDRLIKR